MSTLFRNSDAAVGRVSNPSPVLSASSRSPLTRVDRVLSFRWVNILGHRQYRLCYVRQRTRGKAQITDDMWSLVECLMSMYVEQIGCRGRREGTPYEIDAADMKAVLDRLLSHGEKAVRAAIVAKSASLRMSGGHKLDAAKYVPRTPKAFFDGKFEYWLGNSKSYASDQAAAAAERARHEQAQRDADRIAREREHAATPAQTRAVCAEVLGRRKSMQEIIAEEDAHWALLTGDQQRKALDAAVAQMAAILGGRVGEHHRDQVARSARRIGVQMFPEGASK